MNSIPVNSSSVQSASDFDWSQPVIDRKEDTLELNWDDDEEEENSEDVTDNAKNKEEDLIPKPEKGEHNLNRLVARI